MSDPVRLAEKDVEYPGNASLRTGLSLIWRSLFKCDRVNDG